MNTPQFKGTHLFDRLCWAKENLDGVQSDYRVVYEDNIEECAKILHGSLIVLRLGFL